MINERNLQLDGLKFFLVCLVVVGHCVQPFRYDSVSLGWIYGIIYSFHMPLFVMLSGYFFKVGVPKQELWKCIKLLETFFIVTIVFWFAEGRSYSWPLIRLGGCPSWYLISLVWWRVCTSVMLKRLRYYILLIISVILSIIAYIFLNRGEGIISIMRMIQFYPYFLLGYMIKQKCIRISTFPTVAICITAGLSNLIICYYAGYPLYTQEFQSIGALHWCKWFNVSLLGGAGVFLFVKIASLGNSFFVWKYLRLPDYLARFGDSSLLIYAVHTMTLPLIYHHCTYLWQTTIIAIVTIVSLMCLSRMPISKFITNPICSVLEFLRIKYNL